jgi:serine/threonine protein kinase
MATSVFKEYFRGYEILGELGRGNARVLKAKQISTGKLFAIKHFSFNTDEETLRRFQQESAIMKSIQHDYVVKVFDIQLDAELPYIVMELIEGGDLRGLLKEKGHFDIATILRLAWHMTDALEIIHTNNVVHRDIKPENIMFRRMPGGELHFLLTDFGIAKVRERRDQITVTGSSMLTYEYASPEQFNQSKLVSIPADYYSLGVVLYECLTGSVPFNYSNGDLLQYIHSVLSSPVPVPFVTNGENIPAALRKLLNGLLEKSTSARIADPQIVRGLLREAAMEDLRRTQQLVTPKKTQAYQPSAQEDYVVMAKPSPKKRKVPLLKMATILFLGMIIFWMLRAGQSYYAVAKKSLQSIISGNEHVSNNSNSPVQAALQNSDSSFDDANETMLPADQQKDKIGYTTAAATNPLALMEPGGMNEDGGITMVNDIYYNDFSNKDDSIWKNEDTGNEFYINNGKYIISGDDDNFTFHSSIKVNIDIQKDFNISATATRQEGSTNFGFGLNYCGDTDADKYAVFYISANGYYSIRSWEKDHWKVYTDWTPSSAIHTGTDMNTLLVEKRGEEIHFYINDKLVQALPFTGGYGNYFGFRVDGGQTVAFDQLLIKGHL